MAIRITGGNWGGRFVKSPDGRDTRPTSSITRQALFNILAEDIEGALVLDLFAGSGVISAEALSRGAQHSTLIEMGKSQSQLLRSNFECLGALSQVRIISQDALKLDPSVLGKFHLIYADPPFTKSYPDLRNFLACLVEGGTAVFEMPSRNLPAWSEEAIMLRKYGESTLAFFS